MPDEAFLPELAYKTSGICYITIDLVNAFFSFQLKKRIRNNLHSYGTVLIFLRTM